MSEGKRRGIDMKKWAEMTPRERDALVEEKVFGTDRLFIEKLLAGEAGFQVLPYYTINIADAWGIMEKFDWIDVGRAKSGIWVCTIRFYEGFEYEEYKAYESTAPEAICIAALRASGVEI